MTNNSLVMKKRKRSITAPWNFIASTVIILLKWLFSQTLLLLEGEKANCHCFHVEIA